MLIIAIPKGLPYGYYVLLRWIMCGLSAYIAYLNIEKQNRFFSWAFGILAVIFNPIIPLYLGKDIWVIIDLIAILLFFLYLINQIKERR